MEPATLAPTEDTRLLRREIDRLRSDMDRLRNDMSSLAEDALRAVRTGAAQAKERIGRNAHATAEKGREAVDALENQVAQHPLVSLGSALAVGLIVGIGLSRKD